MPNPEIEGDKSGAEQRQDWFMGQRTVVLRKKPPQRDITEALSLPPDPPTEPPSLPDLMREYRIRLQNRTDRG